MDSLSPFQVPRRSGMAVCAKVRVAAVNAASVTMQGSVDISFDVSLDMLVLPSRHGTKTIERRRRQGKVSRHYRFAAILLSAVGVSCGPGPICARALQRVSHCNSP